jgi:DNA-binding MurR/RpiR family transcriptional regulator
LIHLRRDVRLLDGAGGLATEQAQLMDDKSVLLAVSFRHYAREVVDIVEAAEARRVPILAITDSQLSPLAKRATVCMVVPDGEYNYARSLAEPICLAQALIICLAQRLDLDPAPADPLSEIDAG